MRNNLPRLTQELLDSIFDNVYSTGCDTSSSCLASDRICALRDVLHVMQRFNYQHRPDDMRRLFDLFNAQFNFEPNSEGTTLWLALILAIQELYGFTDRKLVEVIGQVTIRK